MIINQIAGTATGGINAGISFDTFDGSNNITGVTIYGARVPVYALYNVSSGNGDFRYVTKVDMPNITSIGTRAFYYCIALRKIWIPSSCATITATVNADSPFYNCNAALVIYCEAASKPSGWSTYWNYYSSSQLTVNWGITKAQFDAL